MSYENVSQNRSGIRYRGWQLRRVAIANLLCVGVCDRGESLSLHRRRPIDGIRMSADTHEVAGDKILDGWTWQKLKVVNDLYKFAFFILWTGGGILWYRFAYSEFQENS